MGCANSKAASDKKPDGLQFNAADLDDVDQSTHKKKKVVAIPAAPVVVVPSAENQSNPVADASVVAAPATTETAPAPEVTTTPVSEVPAQ